MMSRRTLTERNCVKLVVIEGLCYVHPHYPELVATHPVMRTLWRMCAASCKRIPGAVMAPLLVDDRPNPQALCMQSSQELILAATGREYASFPWLAPEVSEAELETRYGTLGCSALDALYHIEVLSSLSLLAPEWEWLVIHPFAFQEQQSEMLLELWKRLAAQVDFGKLAGAVRENKDVLRARMRAEFFARFEHVWIGDDDRTFFVTKPVWKEQRVVHEGVRVIALGGARRSSEEAMLNC